MHNFNPGDKVIKRSETDARNYGTVMDIPHMFAKPGYVAVYFQSQVWIKPENLLHFDVWQSKQKVVAPVGSVKDYWLK